MLKVICLVALLILSNLALFAQEKVEMADKMRDNGMIYVVIAVILTILAGIVIYLVRIDRKISNLEKNSKQSKI